MKESHDKVQARMVSPPDGQSLSRAGSRVKQQNEGGDQASRWIQRLLLSAGFVFFLGGLVVVAGGPGGVPLLSDSGASTEAGGPVAGTPTPDGQHAGTPTADSEGHSSQTPTANDGRTGGGSTPTNGSDGTTAGSDGNGTATPTPTPEPIIGIG